jgi:predicted CXXCH cytochrome family protein
MASEISSNHKSRVRCWRQFLLTVILINLFGIVHAEVQPPKNPNSAKACAICHYRWIDTFFIEGRGSDLVGYTSEKFVARPEMCYSCHDGSVADSRDRMTKGRQHKTDVPPPAHMKIPKLLPLDEQGRMQCATCHSAHGVPSDPDSKETIFMRTSNRNSAMCRMCHPQMVGGLKSGNHQIDTATLEIPAEMTSLGALTGDKKNQLVCETCHTAHGSPHESYLIKSGKDSGLCLQCHPDKDILTADGKKKPRHIINATPVNAKIPAALIKKGARVGHNGEIICQSCHKVHNNQIEQRLLLARYDQKATLCLTCHADKKYIADTKHDLLLSAPEEKNLEGNTVAQAGVCSACHLPHKAARKLPGDSQLTKGLCLSCHSNGHIAEKAVLTGTQHPLEVGPSSKKDTADVSLPLFNDSGFQDQSGKITCTTCHDPHRWRADSTPTGKNSKTDRTTSFLRKQAPRICRECHPDKFHITDSKHDLSRVAPQEKNMRNQTPSESGLCGTCHRVHRARKPFLWAAEINTESKPVVQGLCLGCHNRKGMARKKVVAGFSHALNISPVENGLATTLPLFAGNAKVTKDGVIACQTCHDPHRWDPLQNISEAHFEVEGSSQNSFLRLENAPSPKLCANCHPDQGLIANTEHDLLVTAPSSTNGVGQRPLESGTCGACHLVHNSRNEINLWSRDFATGNNIMEMMCNDCHSQKGPAKNKIPQVYLHPREKPANNKGKNTKGAPDYFPLFHGRTGKPVTVGNISCPSCHNVHQWNPTIRAGGMGINTEGDATNSFLRSPASFAVCKDCHAAEAPLKIKNYHDAEKRKFKGIDDMFFQ